MEEKKISEYITQTEAYQFGKKNAIRLVQSKQQLNVALGARYLLDIYKYSYLEIAQFILDSYDIVSLDCIGKMIEEYHDTIIRIVLPDSYVIIRDGTLQYSFNGGEEEIHPFVFIEKERGKPVKPYFEVSLEYYQNITFYALIEDELHKYLKA